MTGNLTNNPSEGSIWKFLNTPMSLNKNKNKKDEMAVVKPHAIYKPSRADARLDSVFALLENPKTRDVVINMFLVNIVAGLNAANGRSVTRKEIIETLSRMGENTKVIAATYNSHTVWILYGVGSAITVISNLAGGFMMMTSVRAGVDMNAFTQKVTLLSQGFSNVGQGANTMA